MYRNKDPLTAVQLNYLVVNSTILTSMDVS